MIQVDEIAVSSHITAMEGELEALKQTLTPPVPPLVPPVARGDAVVVAAGGTVEFELLDNDEAGSSPIVDVRLLTPPAVGTLTVDNSGHGKYVAGADGGSATAVYQDVGADGAESVPATIAITITPPVPVPPKPTPKPARMRGVHAAPSNQGNGPPADIIVATDTVHKALTPKAPWPNPCAVWPGMDKIELMLPGKSIKPDFFQRVTDNGSRVLVQVPLAFRQLPKGWVASDGPFKPILDGKLNQAWADFLGWMASQGQTSPILRIVEPNGGAAMPHAIGNSKNAANLDFSDAKAAYTYAVKKWLQLLPTAHIVISHFRRGYVKVGGHDVYVHPDEYSPTAGLYHGDHVDWYDNTGKTMTPQNAEGLFKEQATSHAGLTMPVGLDRWAAYAASRIGPDGEPHTCAADECGIRCKAGDPPERDNAYFFEATEARAQKLGLEYLAFFRPNGSEHKIFPTCNIGTTNARDKFINLYNIAS